MIFDPICKMNPWFYLMVSLSCGLSPLVQPVGASMALAETETEKNARLKLNIGQLLDEYFELLEKVRFLEGLVEKLVVPRVAFSVTDPTPLKNDDLVQDVTLLYKSVWTNIGSGYDSDTGTFTVETPGMYFFTFFFHTLNKRYGAAEGLELHVNGVVRRVKAIEQVSGGDYGDNAGNAIVLDLNAGDKVTVVIKPRMCIKPGEYTNTFTGFLLKPTFME